MLFATAVIVAHLVGISNDVTALAVIVYFWARVVHAIGYTLAVPWVRTLSFAVGWVATVVIVLQVLL